MEADCYFLFSVFVRSCLNDTRHLPNITISSYPQIKLLFARLVSLKKLTDETP